MTVPRWLWFLALIPAVAWGARVDRFAVGNTSDAELRQVLDDHWRWLQQVDPVKALRAGDSAAP